MGFSNMRSEDKIIAVVLVFFGPKLFNDLANLSAFGMPEDQTCTNFFLDAIKIQVVPDLAVITFLASSSRRDNPSILAGSSMQFRKSAAASDVFHLPSNMRQLQKAV